MKSYVELVGAFAKLRQKTSTSRLSVCPRETTLLTLAWFSRNLIHEDISKYVEKKTFIKIR